MNVNCAILGDNGVGKTTYIQRHFTGDFVNNYTTTSNLTTTKLPYYTNCGVVDFNIYDGPINQILQLPKLDCAMIFFDKTKLSSFENVIYWYQLVIKHFGTIPIIICGNKCDIKNIAVKSKELYNLLHVNYKHLNLLYFDISAKSNYNFEKPFLFLSKIVMFKALTSSYQELLNLPLQFVETPVC